MAKVRPIKVGVIGLGRAGWNIHVARMRDDARFKVTAVTDKLPTRLDQAREELGCETFKSTKKLIEEADAEIIVNAMPSHLHAPLSIDILKSGRHCIVEKPVARTVKETQQMIRATKATGKKLFVHQNYRFQTGIKHYNEIIKSGIIGDVFEIRVCLTSFSRRNDWQTLRKNGGGSMPNTAVHFIDAVMQMLDSPVTDVWGDLKLISDSGDAEDHCRVILRAKSGCVADFLVSTSYAASLPPWTICGTCGTLTSDRKTSTIRYFDPKKVKPLPVDETPPAQRQYGNADKLPWKEKTIPATSKDTSDYYDNVYDVLRLRKKQAVTPESVLAVMKVLDKARSRGVKTWRPQYGKK